MKVYVKKEDKENRIPKIIAIISFLIFPAYIYYNVFESHMSFTNLLETYGIALVISTVFFLVAVMMIYTFFKKPKCYKATLIDKKVETYEKNKITYMTFKMKIKENQEDDYGHSICNCYTIEKNNLVIGNDYALGIKEFNWEPVFVTEIRNNKDNIVKEIPKVSINPIFLLFTLITLTILVICIMGLINHPDSMISYLITVVCSILFLFIAHKVCKRWNDDHSSNHNAKDLNLKLKRIKKLDKNFTKVENIAIRKLIILLIVIFIIWFIVIINIKLTKINYLTILFIEMPIILIILYYINYDERLIEKYKINVTDKIEIPNIKEFDIIIPFQRNIFAQYFIIDQNRNLLFKIKKTGFFENNFIICDFNDIKVGEITSSLFTLTSEFVVNLVNKKPFIIRLKMLLNHDYEIAGRSYYVKGNADLIKNVIYDKNDNEIAYTFAISQNNKNLYNLGNTRTIINDKIKNNIDIILIALCTTMGNLQTFRKNMNKL